MGGLNKKWARYLFLGDMVFFLLSLWLTLLVRHFSIPGKETLVSHLISFSLLIPFWLLTFFIVGLYGGPAYTKKQDLVSLILVAQVINGAIFTFFFYFIPIFGLTPKINAVIYFLFSSAFIILWRIYLSPRLISRKKKKVMVIADDEEMEQLKRALNNHPFCNLEVAASIHLGANQNINFEKDVEEVVKKDGISIVVTDTKNPQIMAMSSLFYGLLFSKIIFVDVHKMYEDVFERVPLQYLKYSWFLENINSRPRIAYLFLKRILDIFLVFFLGFAFLPFCPFVAAAIKIEDGGKIFLKQKRIGQNGRLIRLFKFRTMDVDDNGVWQAAGDKRVTKVGKILRKARIDELPQLWNVLTGDLSFVGPRPDIIDLGRKLFEEIPYYNVRYLVKPGLSGWAQINQRKPPLSVEETKIRLEYDLYYIKNISLGLDLKIALRTIKILLLRLGV